MEKQCTSCKVRITNKDGSVTFMCPNCGKTEIVRCTECRKLATKYKCAECGFTGPN